MPGQLELLELHRHLRTLHAVGADVQLPVHGAERDAKRNAKRNIRVQHDAHRC